MLAVSVHATNKYFVYASLDSSWYFYDVSSGLCLAQVRKKMGLFLLMFHLQGLMEKGSFTVYIFKWEHNNHELTVRRAKPENVILV